MGSPGAPLGADTFGLFDYVPSHPAPSIRLGRWGATPLLQIVDIDDDLHENPHVNQGIHNIQRRLMFSFTVVELNPLTDTVFCFFH